jgi:hypothetical protein
MNFYYIQAKSHLIIKIRPNNECIMSLFKSKNKGLSSKSKKDYSIGKRKGTIGQTMIYKNKLHKLQRKVFKSRLRNKN